MRISSRLATLAVGLSLVAASTHAATRTCVSSTTEGFSISPQYACIGSNPLYKGNSTVVDNPLYSRTSGGVRITLTGANFECVGTPAVSSSGAIVAQVREHKQGHVQVGGMSLTAPQTIVADAAGEDASAAPVITGDGTIIFKSISNGSPVLLTKAPGNSLIGTLPSMSFATISSVACSPRGDIIVAGTTANEPVAAAYVGRVNGGITGTLPDTFNLSLPGVSDVCYDLIVTDSATKKASFIVSPRDSQSGLPTGRRTYTAGRFALECSIACDQSSDLVAMCDTDSIRVISPRDAASGLPTGKSAVVASPPALISIGDPLAGGTVTGLSLSPQAFTGSGELMFWASVLGSDGSTSTGLFAAAVPEPTTLGVIVSASLLAVRRRSRA